MDKNFHNLLLRYVNGDCTAEENEKVERWYREIADNNLDLEADEQLATRARMLASIRKSLAEDHEPARRQRHFFASPFVKVAAVLTVVAIAGVWFFIHPKPLNDDGIAAIPELSSAVVLENVTDSNTVYTLPDGSTVRLGVSSRLKFNKDFSGGKREVYLSGQGFFEVVKDPARPFYVYSREVVTRVLGTSFIVDAPEDGGKVEVQVITGKVSVFQVRHDGASKDEDESSQKNSTANGVVLSPNQKVEYYTEEDHWVTGLVAEPVPVKSPEEEIISFVFENTPVKTVLADIQSRFGIELVTENDSIDECTFTGDVSKMTLYDMLDLISNSIGSTYEVKGTRILISGKGCH